MSHIWALFLRTTHTWSGGQFGQGKCVCARSVKENEVKNLTFVGNESALTEQSMGRHSKFSAGRD